MPFNRKKSKQIVQNALLLICLSIILGCYQKEITPLELAKVINQIYGEHSSLSYDLVYQIKRFGVIEDTTKIAVKVELVSTPENTLLGGYIWMHGDSIDRYYDTKYTYWISHSQKKITQFTPTKNDAFPFNGNFKEALNVYFLRPKNLITGAIRNNVSVTLQDTLINQKKNWQWRYNFLKEEGFKKNQKNIWIQKDNYTITKMNFLSVDAYNESQYNQWDLSNSSFDKVSATDLQERFTLLKANYAFEVYAPKPVIKPLVKGNSIPPLNLEFYPEGQKITLADFKGNTTLIDFWYMDCVPCVKAMPHLNELHQKYAAKGLQILGVNPFDNTEKNLQRLPIFLAKNKIDYPILFTNREELQAFNILGFPTFYLIDKNGKVILSGTGFDKQKMDDLDDLIQTVL